MKKIIIILLILGVIAGSGYAGWQYYQEQRDELWKETFTLAEETLKPIKMSFKSTLMQGMSQGVSEAVNYCKLEAPQITQNIPEGVEVGRTSHKVRNPDNKPSELLEGPLNYFLKLEQQGEKGSAQLAQLPDDSWLYVEPIYTQATCLACHGDNLATSVKQTLQEKYPDDKATGFKEGDFRGIFWMKFKEDFGQE